MCEWLSHEEWCDVRLMCGGRAFSAHRAVLASVSIFLRRLLLSCPTDELPTLIILPDFDLDAMSSILYYIYNGEVFVQKEKLEVFLDIINVMEIHIDSKYLPKKHDTKDYNMTDIQHENKIELRNIFTLGLNESKHHQYVNLKKGNEIQDVLLKYSLSKSDCTDKAIRCENSSSKRKSSLGDLESPFRDRQRNSFLRDLFIETYPRNGNVNGLPTGVLAISNERYRAPASMLLPNANAKHLGADDTLSETYKKTVEHISHSPTVLHPHKQCLRDQQDYGETSNGLYASTYLNICPADSETCYENKEIKTGSTNGWRIQNTTLSHELCQQNIHKHIFSGSHLPSSDLTAAPPMFRTVKSLQRYRNNKTAYTENRETYRDVDSSGASKVAIYNQVLDSPWTPRIPVNYTPFRKKADNMKQLKLPLKPELNCDSIAILNDSNNNVSKASTDVSNIILGNEIKDSVITPNILVHTNKKDDFKCSICNQVFTSNESLTAHTRRHSSNARYTCGECGKTFSQLRNFKYHMSIHRGTREFAATCTVCGKYFNDRGYLSSHMKIHRNRKEYKCTICPKSFNQRVAYNMHVRIHTGVKPHVCEECGKAFSRKMLLKQHQRTHSGERPYACPHCDKRFADRSNMTLHLRLHTGVKPFSCSLCPKSFTKKHHLKSHLNFHTGSKPYSCPRCKLAFTQSSNMRTHLKKCNAPQLSSEGESNQITQ